MYHVKKSYFLTFKNFFLFIDRLWRRLNSLPVCFNAKHIALGQFQVKFGDLRHVLSQVMRGPNEN